MDLFDILVARKYSDGGGGGGGSSPVNTITVTLTDTSGDGKSLSINFTDADMHTTAFIIDPYIETGESSLDVGANETASATVYCLPNCEFLMADYTDNFSNCTITGSAEIIEIHGMNVLSVTGDCTITVS